MASPDVEVSEKARLKGHRWQLSDLEFNVDGTMLASASWDKEVRLWDLFTLDTVCVLKDQHSVPITTVSWFPPDGSLIATGSADCTACLWSVEAGEMLVCLKEHFGWVMDSSFSPNGSALATASWDKTIRIWDPATGSLLTTLNGHTKGVYGCDYHPSATSSVVCSSSEDETIRIWDTRMQGNKPMRTLVGGHEDAVNCCCWSPDGKLIASGGADHTITIWDAREGKVIAQLREHSDAIKSMAFHPGTGPWNGKTLLASAGDTACCLWDPMELAERDLLFRHAVHGTKDVEALAFTPDGTVLATGGRDNEIALSFLSLPGMKDGDEDLAWVKRQNEDKARLLEREEEERRAEELERQQHSTTYSDGSESDEEDDTSEDEGVGSQFSAGPLRKWSETSQLPAEVQRRQMRPPLQKKREVNRRSIGLLLSQLRRRSIYGDRGGLASPSVLRSTKSLGFSDDGDTPYALRQHRLLRRAMEVRSAVAYLGEEVCEHGGSGSEDEDAGEDEEDTGDASATGGMAAESCADVATLRIEAIGAVSSTNIGQGSMASQFEKTKTLSLGKLPEETPSLALSIPASRTNSINNFFAEPDPLPDRPSSSLFDEASVIQELDLALADEEDDDDDIADVYGEPPMEYVAEPIRPPADYIARQANTLTAAAGGTGGLAPYGAGNSPGSPSATLGGGHTLTLGSSPTVQPRPASTLSADSGPPATLQRPTHTMQDLKPAPKRPPKPSADGGGVGGGGGIGGGGGVGGGGGYSGGSDYEGMNDDQENYEDIVGGCHSPAPGTMSTARGSVKSNAGQGSIDSNPKLLAATTDAAAARLLLLANSATAGAATSAGMSSLPPSSSASAQQQRPASTGPHLPSRDPSTRSNVSSGSPMAARRLPQPPPSAGGAPETKHSPSPTSSPSAALTPPPISSRPNSAEIKSGMQTPPRIPSRPTSTEIQKPIVPGRPTLSSRDAATLSPNATLGAEPGRVPYLDSLVEEERASKPRSLPGSPRTAPRLDDTASRSQTPPPTLRRPTSTLPKAAPPPRPPQPASAAQPPAPAPVPAPAPLVAPQPPTVMEQEEYMDFGTAVQQGSSSGGGGGSSVVNEDGNQQDEYMMFDGNEMSVI